VGGFMKKIISCVTLLAFVFSIGWSNIALAQAPEKIKIAVIDLKAKRGIDEMTVSSLTDLICTEIASTGKYSVIGRDDMQAMLEHIADKQLLECDDTKCLAQVGGALGVQQLMSGNIGMIGNTYLINLKLIDIDNVVVLNRISQEYKGDEAGLIGKLKETVAGLFGEKKPAAPAPAPVAQEKPKPTEPELKPVQMTKIEEKKGGFPWLWVGLGAVVVGGGAAAAIMLSGKSSNKNTSGSNLPLPPDFPSSAKRTLKINFNF
jgi:TolB-like protein